MAVGVEFELDETKSKSIPKFERGQPIFSSKIQLYSNLN